MIYSVDCMGILQAEAMRPSGEAAMISIVEPSYDQDFHLPGWGNGRVLYLRFDDLVFAPLQENSRFVLFDEAMASRIACFVREWHAVQESVALFVHCMAGVSRSAAVAYWVHRFFNAPVPEDFAYRVVPNIRVFEVLMSVSAVNSTCKFIE